MAERSTPGKGAICAIYVLGDAEKHGDSIVRGYNKTAICGSVEEDYAE